MHFSQCYSAISTGFLPFLSFVLLQGNGGHIDARQETRPDAPVENQVLLVVCICIYICRYMYVYLMYSFLADLTF